MESLVSMQKEREEYFADNTFETSGLLVRYSILAVISGLRKSQTADDDDDDIMKYFY